MRSARDGVAMTSGIGGRAEDGAVQLEALTKLGGVREIAVVGEGHAALYVPDDEGLGVFAALGSRWSPLRQWAMAMLPRGSLRSTSSVNTSLTRPVSAWPVMTPSSFTAMPQLSLSPVLQGVERVVRDAHDVPRRLPQIDAEYAALLVQLAEYVCSHFSLPVCWQKVYSPMRRRMTS